MANGMPELGSKISLISKADIRYEGRLFTVDPQECTIALANVRSFGTEDRDTQYPIAPQSQIYDYILFRGSDIKDIRVVNNSMPHPTDPAIMQMQLPNGQHLMPHFPPMQPMNTPMVSVIDLLAGASRSTTPLSLLSRNKSPSADLAVQVNNQQGLGNNRDNMHKRQQNQQQLNRGGNYQRDRRDSGRGNNNDYMQNQYDNRYNNNNQRNNNQNGRGGGWMNRNNNNNMRNMTRGRGGGINNGPRMPNQGFRPQYNNKRGPNAKPLKFEDDFDFEKANTQFEELRSGLSKVKVGDEPKTPTSTTPAPPTTEIQQMNGEAEKKDDSGNETGAGEQEAEDDSTVLGYDKSKSFFDNISCEAGQDRNKSKKNDWRQERKLNTETFGIPAKRVNSYRGRGNYYNRSVNNYRGYRPQNNGYSNNRPRGGYNRPASTGVPPNSNMANNNNNQLPKVQSEDSSKQQPAKTVPESIVDSTKQAVVAAAQ